MRIVGREAECARLAGMLDEARAGHGCSVVLRGEPGIGKTALLDHLAENADGCTVVRATGVEFESELALASLSELIGPLFEVLRELPARYADVLMALVPQKIDDSPAPAVAGGGRHAIYAATLALLTAAAARRPLLCLIDDAHWIDDVSAAALLFTARRLLADPALIVFATRDVPEFDAPGIGTLRLEGLNEQASLQLLARNANVPALVGARLAALTMGNPLALLELPRVLPLESAAGLSELVEPLPTTKLLQRAFAASLVSMSTRQRQALLVCAAAGSAELEVVARALGALGIHLAALDEGTVSGLVQITGRTVTFRHPLIRSAVYSQAGPGERWQAHAALADACTSPKDADRRAWHLACASVGPDEQVAAALVATADRARRHGGIVAQAAALERAAELTGEPVPRARRICAAATIWSAAGALDHSEALLDQAEALAGDNVSARIEVLGDRAYHAVLRGRTGDVFDALVAEAAGAGPEDRLAAGRVLSLAMNAPLARWDVAATLEVCTKVMTLTAPDGHPNPSFPKGAVRLALAQVLAGQAAGAELARECVAVCERHVPNGACAELAEVLMYVEDYDLARRMIDHDVAASRAVGDIALLGYGLRRRAQLEIRVGRPLTAYSDALECAGLADAMAQPTTIAASRATLAMVSAVLGRADDCSAHAREAMRLCPDDLETEARVRYAVGLVALAGGRIDDAVVELRRADTVLRAVVEPAVVPVAADLAEALVRAGRPDEARLVLDRLDAAVAATGRRGRRAAALRCRALLARGAGAGPLFDAALEAHRGVDEPLERARTLLCQGQWLRRSRRRQDAYQPLAASLEVFESAEAKLWAEQARHELTVLGLRTVPSAGRPDLGVLTPQEWRIAWAAAQGRTSREIAAEVLLSVRTVDYHLGNVYRKLGVSSRRALIRQLGGSAELPA
ncbi:LuxR family transcriptional regulator [Streptomyces violascens]|uniref:Transcriptional regulator n=1 Tax=Streptomyces violascens TaxID=67381 RepID=A0ABQ3QTU2_9ACTN|nr:LuxR family transcriptional regulator [Streptomyces violascens]GHI40691.1 transcriptional regulator [Streptomyces violascens]